MKKTIERTRVNGKSVSSIETKESFRRTNERLFHLKEERGKNACGNVSFMGRIHLCPNECESFKSVIFSPHFNALRRKRENEKRHV